MCAGGRGGAQHLTPLRPPRTESQAPGPTALYEPGIPGTEGARGPGPACLRASPTGLSHSPLPTERDPIWPGLHTQQEQPGQAALACQPALLSAIHSGAEQGLYRDGAPSEHRLWRGPRACEPGVPAQPCLRRAPPTHQPSPTCSSALGRRDTFLCRLRVSPGTERTPGPAGEWKEVSPTICTVTEAALPALLPDAPSRPRGSARQRDATRSCSHTLRTIQGPARTPAMTVCRQRRQSLESEPPAGRQPLDCRSPALGNAAGPDSPGGHRPAGRHWSHTRKG